MESSWVPLLNNNLLMSPSISMSKVQFQVNTINKSPNVLQPSELVLKEFCKDVNTVSPKENIELKSTKNSEPKENIVLNKYRKSRVSQYKANFHKVTHVDSQISQCMGVVELKKNKALKENKDTIYKVHLPFVNKKSQYLKKNGPNQDYISFKNRKPCRESGINDQDNFKNQRRVIFTKVFVTKKMSGMYSGNVKDSHFEKMINVNDVEPTECKQINQLNCADFTFTERVDTTNVENPQLDGKRSQSGEILCMKDGKSTQQRKEINIMNVILSDSNFKMTLKNDIATGAIDNKIKFNNENSETDTHSSINIYNKDKCAVGSNRSREQIVADLQLINQKIASKSQSHSKSRNSRAPKIRSSRSRSYDSTSSGSCISGSSNSSSKSRKNISSCSDSSCSRSQKYRLHTHSRPSRSSTSSSSRSRSSSYSHKRQFLCSSHCNSKKFKSCHSGKYSRFSHKCRRSLCSKSRSRSPTRKSRYSRFVSSQNSSGSRKRNSKYSLKEHKQGKSPVNRIAKIVSSLNDCSTSPSVNTTDNSQRNSSKIDPDSSNISPKVIRSSSHEKESPVSKVRLSDFKSNCTSAGRSKSRSRYKSKRFRSRTLSSESCTSVSSRKRSRSRSLSYKCRYNYSRSRSNSKDKSQKWKNRWSINKSSFGRFRSRRERYRSRMFAERRRFRHWSRSRSKSKDPWKRKSVSRSVSNERSYRFRRERYYFKSSNKASRYLSRSRSRSNSLARKTILESNKIIESKILKLSFMSELASTLGISECDVIERCGLVSKSTDLHKKCDSKDVKKDESASISNLQSSSILKNCDLEAQTNRVPLKHNSMSSVKIARNYQSKPVSPSTNKLTSPIKPLKLVSELPCTPKNREIKLSEQCDLSQPANPNYHFVTSTPIAATSKVSKDTQHGSDENECQMTPKLLSNIINSNTKKFISTLAQRLSLQQYSPKHNDGIDDKVGEVRSLSSDKDENIENSVPKMPYEKFQEAISNEILLENPMSDNQRINDTSSNDMIREFLLVGKDAYGALKRAASIDLFDSLESNETFYDIPKEYNEYQFCYSQNDEANNNVEVNDDDIRNTSANEINNESLLSEKHLPDQLIQCQLDDAATYESNDCISMNTEDSDMQNICSNYEAPPIFLLEDNSPVVMIDESNDCIGMNTINSNIKNVDLSSEKILYVPSVENNSLTVSYQSRNSNRTDDPISQQIWSLVNEFARLLTPLENELGILRHLIDFLKEVSLKNETLSIVPLDYQYSLSLLREKLFLMMHSDTRIEGVCLPQLLKLNQTIDNIILSHTYLSFQFTPNTMFGLDIRNLAEVTQEMSPSETKKFIKTALIYEGFPKISSGEIDNIYDAVLKKRESYLFNNNNENLESNFIHQDII